MKRRIALLMALMLLPAAPAAFSEGRGDDPVALIVSGHDVTRSDLESAAVLCMFEAALRCAGYGYGFDILDPLNIEDEMDKLVFDMERLLVAQDLAESRGLYPLSDDAYAAAEEEAEEAWKRCREIAWSDNGMAFLPVGAYQCVEDDPEGNITRYFASFGLTKEALLEEAVRNQTYEELKKAETAFMADRSEDEIIDYFSDWFLEKMDEVYIVEYDEIIGQVMENLARDPSENQEGDGYEAYERSIMIAGIYYTLGESTIRDFERNGWSWTQAADGKFSFEITEEGNDFYAVTDNHLPDGKLVMVDMTVAYDIPYEYLSIGFDVAFDPDADTDIWTLLEEVYGGEYTDDGTLQVRTVVKGGILLIEVAEGALRLTLE